MRAAITCLAAEEGTLEMITDHGFRNHPVRAPEFFDPRQLCTESVDLIGDQRKKNPVRLMPAQRLDRATQIHVREIAPLKIDTGKTIHLNIEKRRLLHVP